MTVYSLRAISFILTMLYTLAVLGTCSAAPAVSDDIIFQDTTPASQNGELLSLTIFQPREEISLPLQQAADAFVAEHPGTQIRIHSIEGAAQYQPALRAKLLGGESVDIFHIYGAQDLMQLEEFVLPLTDLPWVTETYPILLAPVTIDDAVYGIPYSLEGIGLIANRAVFNTAGITLGAIDSFEDLAEAFSELRTQIDSGELSEGFPSLLYVTEFAAMDRELNEQLADIALSGAFSTPQQAATSKLINLPKGDAVGEYVKLMARYSSSRADWEGLASTPQSQQLENGLFSERIAVIQHSTSIWGRAIRADETMANNLVLLPVPLEEEQTGSIYVGAPSYWAINAQSDSASIALAKEFLAYLYLWDEGNQIASQKFGLLSPYRNEAEVIDSTLYRQLISYIEYGNVLPFLHNEVPDGWTNEVFIKSLHEFYASDDLNWNTFLSDIQSGWATLR